MRVIKAGFSKTFPYQQYFEKIWLEAELNEGDDERQVLYELKKTAENFFYESKGAAEKQMKDEPIQIAGDESIVEAINACGKLNDLKTYEIISRGNPVLQEAYKNKLIEFRNNL